MRSISYTEAVGNETDNATDLRTFTVIGFFLPTLGLLYKTVVDKALQRLPLLNRPHRLLSCWSVDTQSTNSCGVMIGRST